METSIILKNACGKFQQQRLCPFEIGINKKVD